MSAVTSNPNTPPDHVNIEVDGKAMQVPKGSMIIHATDRAKIPVPRFCYHDKLPIAANCRMCLVDVEKSPKPVPACATPVMEGMKVYTQSKRALDSQRNVMEFLLINHPLDCPICDQGGECELQDVAMGYGRSVSRFNERKRTVADEDLGSLIATDMTRCIHCTRCVRFMSEVAGTHEMGGIFRGEHTEIGTYIGKSIESEIGGNIIDVCPVGALTNKPFRFKARAWELIARESIGYHDAMGSNLYLHTKRGEVMRVVPRDNEAVNECWISDRDRYSHTGLDAADRLTQPMLREGTHWKAIGWDEAIRIASEKLQSAAKQHGSDGVGAVIAPATTNEEGYLLGKLLRGLKAERFDHRLRAIDFADDAFAAPFEMPVAAVEKATAVLLIGSNLRHELPLLNHRVRKAQQRGASVMAVNPVDFGFNLNLTHRFIAAPWALVDELASIVKAASDLAGTSVDGKLQALVNAATVSDAHEDTAKRLKESNASVLILGEIAQAHPAASLLRALSRALASATQSALNAIPVGANAIGLARVAAHSANLDALIHQPTRSYVIYGAELPNDVTRAAELLVGVRSADFVVAFTAFANDTLKSVAHLILPIGLLPEIDGSMVNLDGHTQTVSAGAKLPGDARAGWRVLRALASACGVSEVAFNEFSELKAAAKSAEAAPRSHATGLATMPSKRDGLSRTTVTPIYAGDAVLRRAAPLQATPIAMKPSVWLHAEDALRLGLGANAMVRVSDGHRHLELPAHSCHTIAKGSVLIPDALTETALLAPMGSSVTIEKV